jgi:hypothetical protein
MTMEVLADVLSEFDWPAPYVLEDELPDGIVMRFPRSSLFFVEGFEGDMALEFLPEDTGTDQKLTVGHALSVIVPESTRKGGPITLNLIDDESPYASLEKVKNGIRDLCTIALTHLQPCILGDFGWVAAYKASREGKN